jgi:uncharacterized tellurite resistance protein B-like protein
MKNIFDKIFKQHMEEDKESSVLEKHRFAAACLLIEIVEADDKYTDEEKHTLHQLLSDNYQLDAEEIEQITTLAREEVKEATSLYQFTSLINEHFDNEEKIDLVRQLWQLAYADQHLDKYEEYTIRKVAELLYISHADFIKSKLDAKQNS